MSSDTEVKRSFQVEIEQLKRHVFIIDDVNTQEEAEQVAEAWLADGEEGGVIDHEIVNVDCFPFSPKEDLN